MNQELLLYCCYSKQALEYIIKACLHYKPINQMSVKLTIRDDSKNNCHLHSDKRRYWIIKLLINCALYTDYRQVSTSQNHVMHASLEILLRPSLRSRACKIKQSHSLTYSRLRMRTWVSVRIRRVLRPRARKATHSCLLTSAE